MKYREYFMKKTYLALAVAGAAFVVSPVDVAAISLDSDNKVGNYDDKVQYGVNTKYFFAPTMSAQLGYTYNAEQDRKSTRLNSSHVRISYAVFCLKKKKKYNKQTSH